MSLRLITLLASILGAQLVSAQTTFVTNLTNVNTIANGFVGYAGMKFTTGPSAITVTALGRMSAQSNSLSHTLKFVLASTGADVPGGSVTISNAGVAVGQYKYGTLSSPVTLPANTAYYLVSSENLSSDVIYDGNVTTTSVAVVNNAVYSSGGSWFDEL